MLDEPAKWPELPERIQIAHRAQRSIPDRRPPMHDRMPLWEPHHTYRVLLKLCRNEVVPLHSLVQQACDDRHGMSIQQRRAHTWPKQPQRATSMGLVNGKQLGEVTLSLTLGQLDLVRQQGIRLGLVVAETLISATCMHIMELRRGSDVQFSFALQCPSIRGRNFRVRSGK